MKPIDGEYVSRSQGEKMTGLSWRSFQKLADQGLFGTQTYPGIGVRYKRSDIEALIARVHKPASAEAVAS